MYFSAVAERLYISSELFYLYAYGNRAVRRFKGSIAGLKRIVRCVPWNEGGLDPVPDNVKGDMKWLF